MTRRYDTPGGLRKREQARSTRPREVVRHLAPQPPAEPQPDRLALRSFSKETAS